MAEVRPDGTPPAESRPADVQRVEVRLDDAAVAARLARIDAHLEKVQAAPGPTAQAALDAVRALTEIYGEALARILDRADRYTARSEAGEEALGFGSDPGLAGRLADDELVGHLMVLHGLHPEPPERRAERAVERLRPTLLEYGGDIELTGVEGGSARVRLRSPGGDSGCACGSAAGRGPGSDGVADAVREAVLGAAPELTSVEVVPDPAEEAGSGPATFVPLDALLRRPLAAQAGQ